MSFFITTKKDIKIKKENQFVKQDITDKRIKQIQIGSGKTENVTIEISKNLLNLESDLYLQGPKKEGIQGAKEIIKYMEKKGKDPCKKAKKHIIKFLEDRKNGIKPNEEDIQKAVIDAFVMYQCKSKFIKLSNKDLSKLKKSK